MHFGLLRVATRSIARHAGPAACLAFVACTGGCSNQVREIPTRELQQGGTYLVAALHNEQPGQMHDERPRQMENVRPIVPSNVIAVEPPTPPGVNREMIRTGFEFVRNDDNVCIGADTVDLDFPEPGSPARYVAFALPAGAYTARSSLRAADTAAPTITIRAGQASYLGDLTLEANGDISVRPNLAEAQRHVPVELRPMTVGYSAPAPWKMCTP
jgi:hypothetical protein